MTFRTGAIALVAALGVLLSGSCGGSSDSRFKAAPMGDDLRQMVAEVATIRDLPPPSNLKVGTIPRSDAAALVQRTLTGADRASFARTTTLYRLLGHLAPSEDYLPDYLAFIGDAVIGLYVPADKTLWIVRDGPFQLSDLSSAERSTLAHELTHAVQDSSFDIAARAARVATDLDASLALTCVIEGDAVTNQNLYTARYGAVPGLVPGAGGALLLLAGAPGGVPPSIERELRFPYTTGADWVNVLRQSKGTAPIDAILKGQSLSTAHILHPDLFAQGWQPETVTVPDLRDPLGGWKRESGGTFGEFGLYNYLQLKLPALTALSAAAGWVGDHYDVYTHGKESLAVFRVRFKDSSEAEEFVAAQQTLLDASGAGFTTAGSVSLAALDGARTVARPSQSGNEVIFVIGTSPAAARLAVKVLGEGSP